MNSFKFTYGKRKKPAAAQVQYLALNSEPEETSEKSRPSYTYQSRYLAKRRVMRRLRRIRREQT